MAQQTPSKERLKRYLYIANEQPKFVVGDAEKHNRFEIESVPSVSQILQSQNPEDLFNVVEIVNSENATPKRDMMFFVLASAATSTLLVQQNRDDLKRRLYSTLSAVCKNDDDLFLFIKFYNKLRKTFPSSLAKFVGNYYTQKQPMELARNVAEATGYHGWKHKDLIKLSHCKSDNIQISIIFKYILFGLKQAKEFNQESPESKQIIEYLEKVENFKRCEDELKVAELLLELNFSLRQLPTHFVKSKIVWEVLIPVITLDKLLNQLPQLYKLGFFKGGPLQAKVIEVFTSAERISQSKIHPVDFFIGSKNFEKGGKPMDPKLVKYLEEKGNSTNETEVKAEEGDHKKIGHVDPPKCQPLTSALHRALNISYNNLQPTGKRFMITVDLCEKMEQPCMRNKNVSCLEAAVVLLLCFVKTEREVTVAVFNDSKITLVPFERNISYYQALNKLRQAKKGLVMPSAIFEWAINKKKNVDVFINVYYYHNWILQLPREVRDKEKPVEFLNKYRKRVNSTAKLINISLSTPHLAIADGSTNILDICGFDSHVPKVIEAFCRGLFH